MLCLLQAAERAAKARVEALAEMAAMVRGCGAERFARCLSAFEGAALSHDRLRLLVDSMAIAQTMGGVIYSF